MSHNPLKNVNVKTVRTSSHNSTPAPSPYSLKRVTQNSTSTVLRNLKKGRRFESKSTSSPFTPKRVTQNAASLVSRSPQVSHRLKITPTSSYPPKGVTRKNTPAQARNPQKKSRGSLTQSVTQDAQTRQPLKYSSSQTITKASQDNQLTKASAETHLFTSPGIKDKGVRTTVVSSSTVHDVNDFASFQNKTALFTRSRSTMKMELSATVNAKSETTKHTSVIQPNSALSSTFYFKAQTSAVRLANQAGQGSNEKVISLLQTAKINDIGNCKESQILRDVSPPSGTAIALGHVSDMRTCIHLSCDVGGDVAYMRNLQCFVITCDSNAICEPRELKPSNNSSDVSSQVALLRKRDQSDKGRLRRI